VAKVEKVSNFMAKRDLGFRIQKIPIPEIMVKQISSKKNP
jgi:hypothetical protein